MTQEYYGKRPGNVGGAPKVKHKWTKKRTHRLERLESRRETERRLTRYYEERRVG